MREKNTTKKKLSQHLRFNIILFGMMGQILWNIENIYFNTACCARQKEAS